MHRLPIRQIQDRVMRGDTIIVDLNGLIHMDTQTNACRRSLKQIGDEMNIDIFALDESDKLYFFREVMFQWMSQRMIWD